MLSYIYNNIDLDVILASLSGALVYMLSHRHFDRIRQLVAFCVSFVMGIIGANFTMGLVRDFIPATFNDGRAIGAFLCSALVVTVVIKIIFYIKAMVPGKKT